MLGFWVQDLVIWVEVLFGSRIRGSGFGVWVLGFWVEDLGIGV